MNTIKGMIKDLRREETHIGGCTTEGELIIALESLERSVEIPYNATNGDMIKAMFPNAKFDNAMPFTDGRWETMNLDTENETRATYKPTQLRTYADWWNAPYKEESEVN